MARKRKKERTIGPSFEIEQEARHRFFSWMPSSSLVRKQDPDVHLDYHVEVVENGEPTGRHFWIQLKGCKRVNPAKPTYSYKTKHLKYYVEKCTDPVFLVLIDISSGQGYWVFAQKYLREEVKPQKIITKASHCVGFAPENNLSEFAQFAASLSAAERYMRELHPGPLEAAIRKRREELEAKDPRLSVSISFDRGEQHIQLTPKEPIDLKLHFAAKDRDALEEKLRNLIDHGIETKFSPAELKITGSPLLEELFGEHTAAEFALKFGNDHPTTVELIAEGDGPPIVLQIEGVLQAGAKYVSFNGELPGSPFQVKFSSPIHDQTFRLELNFLFDIKAWAAKPVLTLPEFDRLHEALKAFNSARALTTRISVRGNRIGTARGPLNALLIAPEIIARLEWLWKLRHICRYFKLNLPFPNLGLLSREEVAKVEYVSDLVDGKEVRERAPSVHLSFTVDKSLDASILDKSSGLLRIEGRPEELEILGRKIIVGPLSNTFSEVSLLVCKALPDGGTAIEFQGKPTSERFVRLVNASGARGATV